LEAPQAEQFTDRDPSRFSLRAHFVLNVRQGSAL